MVDLLITILIVGSAVFYLIELIDNLQTIMFAFRRATLNYVFAMPLSAAGLYAFGHWDRTLFVLVPAATLVSLVLNLWLNKPTVIQNQRLPRIY